MPEPIDDAAVRTGAGRHRERHHACDERERRHHDRPEPQPRAGDRGVDQRRAAVIRRLGELDDQDRVLRRQPIVVSSATRKYTSFSRPRRFAAITAPTMPSGITSNTENGTDQLS